MKKIRFEPHKYEKEELIVREMTEKAQKGYDASDYEIYRRKGTASDFYVALHRESLTEGALSFEDVQEILEEEYAIAYEEWEDIIRKQQQTRKRIEDFNANVHSFIREEFSKF